MFLILLVSPAPEGLPDRGKLVAGITLWLVVWWVTEAVSIYATAHTSGSISYNRSLITTSGGSRIHESNNYSSIGDGLVVAVEKSGLQRKIAFGIISIFGYSPKRIILGFMILYGFNFHGYYEHYGSYFDYSNGFRHFILAI